MIATSTTRASAVHHIGVGIDTSRYGHRVAFLRSDKQPATKPITIRECTEGYAELKSTLERLHQKNPKVEFHVHIDAAGQYATNLIEFLRSLSLPLTISIGEPTRNKNYHKAVSPKRTSDDTESHAMARFGVVEQPAAMPEVPAQFYVLREYVSRLEGLSRDSTRAKNRLHNLMARVFPELATTVNDLAALSILQLLVKYPTPERIVAAGVESLKQIPYLKERAAFAIYSAAKTSIEMLPILRTVGLLKMRDLKESKDEQEAAVERQGFASRIFRRV